ncbi:MAG: Xaa-Pro peptidase family protein [candidate division WOR-3 bacterium]
MDIKSVLVKYTEFVPYEEIERRLQEFKNKMDVDLAILGYPPDILYLAGTKQEGWLIVPKDKNAIFCCIKDPGRARIESPIEVVPIRSIKDLPKVLSDYAITFDSVGTEKDVLSWDKVNAIEKALGKETKNISNSIREIKAVKSRWEIDKLKKSAEIVKAGYKKFVEELREGITEIELHALSFVEMRKLGHEAGEYMRGGRFDGFIGYVISGIAGLVPSFANAPLHGIGISPALPSGPSFKKIEKGEPVIFDSFGTYMGYLVDMTRTAGIKPLPDKVKEAHKVVVEIHEWLRENLRSGVDAATIYDSVTAMVEKTPFKDYFMNCSGSKVNFIGHGVGIEINEYPFIAKGFSMELKENMVVAIEPKIFLPEIGAVGIENTYLVTSKGGVVITDAPEELFEK